jgi:RNA polymerase sigma-70 factor (ECF subfamily)
LIRGLAFSNGLRIKPSVEPRPSAAAFATTHWSVVLAAGGHPQSREALETLCRAYWRPLHAFVMRKGFDVETAEDLTQEFFASLLARDDLAATHPNRGRFRTFLLSALDHFLANEWRKRDTLKRGGHLDFISLDDGKPDAGRAVDPATDLTPTKLYERRWAMTLKEQALEHLRVEAATAGKTALFAALREFLTEPPAPGDYPPLARKLDMTENALRVAVHRLRERYRVLLRAEIARTVENPAAVDDEIRELFAALS